MATFSALTARANGEDVIAEWFNEIKTAGTDEIASLDATIDALPIIGNIGLTAVVSSSNMDITLTTSAGATPTASDVVNIPFRHETLTTGQGNIRAVTSTRTLQIPSGATLGAPNAIAWRLYVYAIDYNDGTVELAVSRLQLDQSALHTTVASTAASDSNRVLYSTTARTSIPIRLLGYVESTQATAGTYLTAPSTIYIGETEKEAIVAVYDGNAGQAMTGSDAVITFLTETEDTHNAYSSGVFTVPEAGKYRAVGKIFTSDNGSSGEYIAIDTEKNSAPIDVGQNITTGSPTQWSAEVDTTTKYVAGDTIRFVGYGTWSGSSFTLSTSVQRIKMSIIKVS